MRSSDRSLALLSLPEYRFGSMRARKSTGDLLPEVDWALPGLRRARLDYMGEVRRCRCIEKLEQVCQTGLVSKVSYYLSIPGTMRSLRTSHALIVIPNDPLYRFNDSWITDTQGL